MRFENTFNEFTEFVRRPAPEVTAAGFPVSAATGEATTYDGIDHQYRSLPRAVREQEYHNYFPSVVAKYRISPNLEWQAGFNKAISRPPIDNITGSIGIDNNNDRITIPNSELEPEHPKNYQTRLAYYFGGRSPGQLSVALSQNDIRNLREAIDIPASEYGITDPEFSTWEVRQVFNSTERRRFRSLDINYNQTLGFLPDKLRGLNVNLNYSRSYANLRRNKLAPHRVTSRLGYAYRRFNGNLGMVWIHESPNNSGNANYGRYNAERTQFDLTLNFRLNRYATLYVQGRNITNQPVKWYDTPTGFVEGSYPVLRQYQEYGANWVFGVKGTF